jgi:protein disulfide-isomerase
VKKLSILFLAGLITFGCADSNKANDQAKIETNNHDKNGLVWHTNLEEAVAIAKAENKPVFLQFSGSDWCKWCIRLNEEVLFTPEFAAWAKENIVLVNLDFPQTIPQTEEVKLYNRSLMNKYGVRGFPTVLLLDNETNVVLQTGYQAGGPARYIAHIKEAYGME